MTQNALVEARPQDSSELGALAELAADGFGGAVTRVQELHEAIADRSSARPGRRRRRPACRGRSTTRSRARSTPRSAGSARCSGPARGAPSVRPEVAHASRTPHEDGWRRARSTACGATGWTKPPARSPSRWPSGWAAVTSRSSARRSPRRSRRRPRARSSSSTASAKAMPPGRFVRPSTAVPMPRGCCPRSMPRP